MQSSSRINSSLPCLPVLKRSEVLSQVTYLPRSELGGKGLSFNALELEMGLNSVVEKGKVRSVHARCKADVLRMALSFYGGQCGFGGERDFFFENYLVTLKMLVEG